jgi:hypothetical protein
VVGAVEEDVVERMTKLAFDARFRGRRILQTNRQRGHVDVSGDENHDPGTGAEAVDLDVVEDHRIHGALSEHESVRGQGPRRVAEAPDPPQVEASREQTRL